MLKLYLNWNCMLGKNTDWPNHCLLTITKGLGNWVQVNVIEEWSPTIEVMSVTRLSLHLWRSQIFLKQANFNFFHQKFCSCVNLENQKFQNQPFKTVVIIDLRLTVWKVSVFGVILARVYPYLDQNSSKYGHVLRSNICL